MGSQTQCWFSCALQHSEEPSHSLFLAGFCCQWGVLSNFVWSARGQLLAICFLVCVPLAQQVWFLLSRLIFRAQNEFCWEHRSADLTTSKQAPLRTAASVSRQNRCLKKPSQTAFQAQKMVLVQLQGQERFLASFSPCEGDVSAGERTGASLKRLLDPVHPGTLLSFERHGRILLGLTHPTSAQ